MFQNDKLAMGLGWLSSLAGVLAYGFGAGQRGAEEVEEDLATDLEGEIGAREPAEGEGLMDMEVGLGEQLMAMDDEVVAMDHGAVANEIEVVDLTMDSAKDVKDSKGPGLSTGEGGQNPCGSTQRLVASNMAARDLKSCAMEAAGLGNQKSVGSKSQAPKACTTEKGKYNRDQKKRMEMEKRKRENDEAYAMAQRTYGSKKTQQVRDYSGAGAKASTSGCISGGSSMLMASDRSASESTGPTATGSSSSSAGTDKTGSSSSSASKGEGSKAKDQDSTGDSSDSSSSDDEDKDRRKKGMIDLGGPTPTKEKRTKETRGKGGKGSKQKKKAMERMEQQKQIESANSYGRQRPLIRRQPVTNERRKVLDEIRDEYPPIEKTAPRERKIVSKTYDQYGKETVSNELNKKGEYPHIVIASEFVPGVKSQTGKLVTPGMFRCSQTEYDKDGNVVRYTKDVHAKGKGFDKDFEKKANEINEKAREMEDEAIRNESEEVAMAKLLKGHTRFDWATNKELEPLTKEMGKVSIKDKAENTAPKEQYETKDRSVQGSTTSKSTTATAMDDEEMLGLKDLRKRDVSQLFEAKWAHKGKVYEEHQLLILKDPIWKMIQEYWTAMKRRWAAEMNVRRYEKEYGTSVADWAKKGKLGIKNMEDWPKEKMEGFFTDRLMTVLEEYEKRTYEAMVYGNNARVVMDIEGIMMIPGEHGHSTVGLELTSEVDELLERVIQIFIRRSAGGARRLKMWKKMEVAGVHTTNERLPWALRVIYYVEKYLQSTIGILPERMRLAHELAHTGTIPQMTELVNELRCILDMTLKRHKDEGDMKMYEDLLTMFWEYTGVLWNRIMFHNGMYIVAVDRTTAPMDLTTMDHRWPLTKEASQPTIHGYEGHRRGGNPPTDGSTGPSIPAGWGNLEGDFGDSETDDEIGGGGGGGNGGNGGDDHEKDKDKEEDKDGKKKKKKGTNEDEEDEEDEEEDAKEKDDATIDTASKASSNVTTSKSSSIMGIYDGPITYNQLPDVSYYWFTNEENDFLDKKGTLKMTMDDELGEGAKKVTLTYRDLLSLMVEHGGTDVSIIDKIATKTRNAMDRLDLTNLYKKKLMNRTEYQRFMAKATTEQRTVRDPSGKTLGKRYIVYDEVVKVMILSQRDHDEVKKWNDKIPAIDRERISKIFWSKTGVWGPYMENVFNPDYPEMDASEEWQFMHGLSDFQVPLIDAGKVRRGGTVRATYRDLLERALATRQRFTYYMEFVPHKDDRYRLWDIYARETARDKSKYRYNMEGKKVTPTMTYKIASTGIVSYGSSDKGEDAFLNKQSKWAIKDPPKVKGGINRYATYGEVLGNMRKPGMTSEQIKQYRKVIPEPKDADRIWEIYLRIVKNTEEMEKAKGPVESKTNEKPEEKTNERPDEAPMEVDNESQASEGLIRIPERQDANEEFMNRQSRWVIYDTPSTGRADGEPGRYATYLELVELMVNNPDDATRWADYVDSDDDWRRIYDVVSDLIMEKETKEKEARGDVENPPDMEYPPANEPEETDTGTHREDESMPGITDEERLMDAVIRDQMETDGGVDMGYRSNTSESSSTTSTSTGIDPDRDGATKKKTKGMIDTEKGVIDQPMEEPVRKPIEQQTRKPSSRVSSTPRIIKTKGTSPTRVVADAEKGDEVRELIGKPKKSQGYIDLSKGSSSTRFSASSGGALVRSGSARGGRGSFGSSNMSRGATGRFGTSTAPRMQRSETTTMRTAGGGRYFEQSANDVGYSSPKAKKLVTGARMGVITPMRSLRTKTINGMPDNSVFKGNRTVRQELHRDMDMAMLHTMDIGIKYRIVYAEAGYGVGVYDPDLNREIDRDNYEVPKIMQFGYKNIVNWEFWCFPGEAHIVKQYRRLMDEHGRLLPIQSTRDQLEKFIGPEGIPIANTVAIDSVRYDKATTSQVRTFVMVHESKEVEVEGIATWTCHIDTIERTEPLEIANGMIAYEFKDIPKETDIVTMDGISVTESGVRMWKKWNCWFTWEEPVSTIVGPGFWPLRIRPHNSQDLLDSLKIGWTEKDPVKHALKLRTETEISAAVVVYEAHLEMKRAALANAPIKDMRYVEPYTFKVTLNLDGMDDHRKEQVSMLNRSVKITRKVYPAEAGTMGRDEWIMTGTVEKSYYKDGVLEALTVKMVGGSGDRGKRMENETRDEVDGDLSHIVSNMQGMGLEMEEKGMRFYREHLSGRQLHIWEADTNFVWRKVHGYAKNVFRSGMRGTNMDTKINAAMNGRINQGVGVGNHLRPEPPKENEARTKVVNAILSAELDQGQQNVLMGILNGEPLVTMQAPGGTGKSTMIANAAVALIGLGKDVGNKILIVTGTNEASVVLANHLGETADGKRCKDRIMVVSSTYASTGKLSSTAKEYTMYAKARLVLKDHMDRLLEKEILALRAYIEMSQRGKVTLEGLREVKDLILKLVKPDILITTIDMALMHARIRGGKTTLIVDEASMANDFYVRVLMSLMQGKKQIILVGDTEQLGPYTQLTKKDVIRWGKVSVFDHVMKRRTFRDYQLVVNRRSIPDLIPMIKRMSLKYESMESDVEPIDHNVDNISMYPPTPREDGCVILLDIGTKHEIDGQVTLYSPESQKVVLSMLESMNKMNKSGLMKNRAKVLLMTNYNGDKRRLMEGIENAGIGEGIEILTTDAAMGKQKDRAILVIGRARRPERDGNETEVEEGGLTNNTRGSDTDFARDDKRFRVGATRPIKMEIIVGNMDYLMESDRRACHRYLMEAAKRNPVLKGLEYAGMLEAFVEQAIAEKNRNPGYEPSINYYGNGVIMKDMFGGSNPGDLSHLSECRLNANNKWLDRRIYLKNVEAGYTPPMKVPYTDKLPELKGYYEWAGDEVVMEGEGTQNQAEGAAIRTEEQPEVERTIGGYPVGEFGRETPEQLRASLIEFITRPMGPNTGGGGQDQGQGGQ